MVIRSIWCWTASGSSVRPTAKPTPGKPIGRPCWPISLSGQDQRPLRIVAFKTEAWARDVTAEIAQEVSALADQDLSPAMRDLWSGRG